MGKNKNNNETNLNRTLAMQNPKNQMDMLTEQQVADKLNVHPITVKRWRNKGTLKAYYFGHHTIRYMQKDIDEFVNQAGYQAGGGNS